MGPSDKEYFGVPSPSYTFPPRSTSQSSFFDPSLQLRSQCSPISGPDPNYTFPPRPLPGHTPHHHLDLSEEDTSCIDTARPLASPLPSQAGSFSISLNSSIRPRVPQRGSAPFKPVECVRCRNVFDARVKGYKGDCVHHPGQLVTENYERLRPGSLEYQRTGGAKRTLIWTCCDGRPESSGCCAGQHKMA